MTKTINCKQAKKLMNQQLTIFDVRDQIAFEDGHIDGAILLSGKNFLNCCKQTNKNIPTLVYCYKGKRSQTLARILAKQGFRKVYSLEGGFYAWQHN